MDTNCALNKSEDGVCLKIMFEACVAMNGRTSNGWFTSVLHASGESTGYNFKRTDIETSGQ